MVYHSGHSSPIIHTIECLELPNNSRFFVLAAIPERLEVDPSIALGLLQGLVASLGSSFTSDRAWTRRLENHLDALHLQDEISGITVRVDEAPSGLVLTLFGTRELQAFQVCRIDPAGMVTTENVRPATLSIGIGDRVAIFPFPVDADFESLRELDAVLGESATRPDFMEAFDSGRLDKFDLILMISRIRGAS